MFKDGKIWIAQTADGQDQYILPSMANRHGLIAGATGTGKTVTLKVLAESFSDAGVPVFLADVKGDLAGMVNPGTDSPDMQKRIEKFGLAAAGFAYKAYPVTYWDIYGEKGLQLRTTISEMGPLLLGRILGLNETQSQILTIVFKIADDNSMLLDDTKDLKAMLNYVQENAAQYKDNYGNISSASVDVIKRAVSTLELDGGDKFFGEPALAVNDWFTTGLDGRGMINILDSESLINKPTLYSTFLLWMMSELFETLPEVGDLDRPKMVFFFDEAHLLFNDAPKVLLDKIGQVVKLIRSKGVGIFFITQNPRDIPNDVLAQLGNKIEHGLHAYTPLEQKAVRAAADSFRENPAFDTFETLMNLGTGEAVISFLDEKGMPGISQKVAILPPQSQMGAITDSDRDRAIKSSVLYTRYAAATDRDSAYEFLKRRGLEEEAKQQQEAAAVEADKEKAAADKLQAKEEAAQEKAKAREEQHAKTATKRAAKSVAGSVTGTIGRQVGRALGSNFGTFGKTLGGNLGASLGRGILSTLFKL
ncbi:MAG: DUF853 domain-containing protein [Lachnospiraceae bacterium]|jgi:DNA helicase HerA-like ATPase|nr:DUF853 domain-containing protein [Lachnospiraceae bacterium]